MLRPVAPRWQRADHPASGHPMGYLQWDLPFEAKEGKWAAKG